MPESASTTDKLILERVKRSRSQAEDRMAEWRETMEFARGNQYAYINGRNKLTQQATRVTNDGKGKPNWRVRQARNLIFPVLDGKISSATQRVPGYEVIPSSSDAEDISGAYLAAKIARAGYDIWRLKRATEEAVYYALTPGEAFAMAYWDSSIGPYVDTDKGPIGIGDVRVRVYGSPEVSWEPGCQFEDSPYWVIENARSVQSIQQEHGYIGGKLVPDANPDWRQDGTRPSQMVMVTEYLERPCPKYPQGRWLIMANDREIFPEQGYPIKNKDGQVLDQPCLHRLSYAANPGSDRDQGLVKQLIEPQRTFNDALNKISEWKNVALNPQILAPVGSLDSRTRPSDEPGSIVYYNPIIGHEPKWRPVPPIPSELFALADRMQSLIGSIASSSEIPSQVESGKGMQAWLESNASAWANFISKLADWHSAIMRDCLTLVQRHYTEPRLIQFRGRTGWEQINSFRGQDIRGQADVRVSAGSLEPRSRQAVEQRVMNFAQLGWVSPEAAMSAIEGGNAEKLIESYELDVSRANAVINKIKAGTFLEEPMRPSFPGEDAIDPETGALLTEIPGWMPRPMIDNVAVHRAVFGDWFKTDDWDNLQPEAKEAGMLYYSALLQIEQQEAARAQEMQNQMAESQGMMNAAKPAIGAKPSASMPAIEGAGQS